MSSAAWSRVTLARESLPEFILPTAAVVGPRDAGVAMPDAPQWQSVQDLLRRAVPDRVARTELIGLIDRALADWPAGPSETAGSLDAIEAPQTHDEYFRIGRTSGDPTAGYLGGVGRALLLMLDEVHETGELREYLGLAQALLGLWSQGWPGPNADRFESLARMADRSDIAAVPLLQRAHDPLRRWMRGHHLFAALTQGMVWSLNHLPPAMASGDDELAERVLLALATLYRASAAAFRFTADFDPAVYAEVLRPTMCEPYMPKGFSGTLSSDHGVLVARLTALRETLTLAQQRWPAAYAQMRDALGAVYDNHRWVCERFDGANVPSLRTSSVSGETAAVDMLDRFRARRLEMLR